MSRKCPFRPGCIGDAQGALVTSWVYPRRSGCPCEPLGVPANLTVFLWTRGYIRYVLGARKCEFIIVCSNWTLSCSVSFKIEKICEKMAMSLRKFNENLEKWWNLDEKRRFDGWIIVLVDFSLSVVCCSVLLLLLCCATFGRCYFKLHVNWLENEQKHWCARWTLRAGPLLCSCITRNSSWMPVAHTSNTSLCLSFCRCVTRCGDIA